jgi:putative addiction module component (TIGR02574 family)
MTIDALLEQVKALPMAERIEFARRVWDDVNEIVESAPTTEESAEIDWRLQEHIESPSDLVPWEEAKSRLDAKYKR